MTPERNAPSPPYPASASNTPGATPAARELLNGRTFVIDAPDLGYGERQKIVRSFDGKKLNFHRTVDVGEGREASVDGERGVERGDELSA